SVSLAAHTEPAPQPTRPNPAGRRLGPSSPPRLWARPPSATNLDAPAHLTPHCSRPSGHRPGLRDPRPRAADPDSPSRGRRGPWFIPCLYIRDRVRGHFFNRDVKKCNAGRTWGRAADRHLGPNPVSSCGVASRSGVGAALAPRLHTPHHLYFESLASR